MGHLQPIRNILRHFVPNIQYFLLKPSTLAKRKQNEKKANHRATYLSGLFVFKIQTIQKRTADMITIPFGFGLFGRGERAPLTVCVCVCYWQPQNHFAIFLRSHVHTHTHQLKRGRAISFLYRFYGSIPIPESIWFSVCYKCGGCRQRLGWRASRKIQIRLRQPPFICWTLCQCLSNKAHNNNANRGKPTRNRSTKKNWQRWTRKKKRNKSQQMRAPQKRKATVKGYSNSQKQPKK